MATEKPRINITTEAATHKALVAAAKREGVPLATKAAELLEVGLALEEDLLLAAVAQKRARGKVNYVPHDDAWL